MDQWTEANISDQTERVALITGANSGIGFHTARALAEHGAHVVLACRTRAKAETARTEILRGSPDADVTLLDLDLASLASVRSAAETFAATHDRLDLLVNNAGVMATPYQRTVDGYELQFATNHLGHHALTAKLLPLLLATAQSRVVAVSSLAHRMGKINFADLQSERGYNSWRAYGQSKLANLLFTFELQRRLRQAGAETIATAAHPGISDTGLANSTGGLSAKLMKLTNPIMSRMNQSAQMGALPTLRAAVDPAATGGEYFGPGGFMEQRGHPKQVKAMAKASDPVAANKLWKVSSELTDARFEGLGE